MTMFFVKKFKQKRSLNACANCGKDKLSGYSMCAKHLERARLEFENWSNERRAVGRCIGCDRVSLKANTLATRGAHQLRCWFHAAINRARISKWQKAHPNYSHQSWLAHRDRYKACRDAGHERNGHKVCNGCSHRSGYRWRSAQSA